MIPKNNVSVRSKLCSLFRKAKLAVIEAASRPIGNIVAARVSVNVAFGTTVWIGTFICHICYEIGVKLRNLATTFFSWLGII